MLTRLTAAALCALAFAAPSAAFAQSAGDQQYQDPLGSGSNGGSQGGGSGGGSPSGGGSGSGGGTSGAQSTPSAPSGGSTSPASAAASPTASGSASPAGEIPRTGGEPIIIAAFGAAFVLVGAGTRLAVPQRG